MKGYREDWAQESEPLAKSKTKGKDLTTVACPNCKARVIVIDGVMQKHECLTKKN